MKNIGIGPKKLISRALVDTDSQIQVFLFM